MRSTIAASLCALVVAGSGIAEANKGNSTYLYKCGTYYPKAFFYKPWTWKYYKYAKYGYYVGDCKKTHSSNKTMDLNEAAPKYVGIQRVNKADTYLLDGPLSIYENGVAVPAPEEDDYFCTCECSTQEHSIGCVGFLLDSDGNPAFPILPLAGGNGTNTTGNGTVSGGYVFASVNGSNYVPTLRTFVPHFDDSYSHHAHLFFTGKSTSYVFTAEEGIIFGANGTNATNATNGTDGFAYIQAQMNSLISAHKPGQMFLELFSNPSLYYLCNLANPTPDIIKVCRAAALQPYITSRVPLLTQSKMSATSCAAPAIVSSRCGSVCASALNKSIITTNQFAATC